MGRCVFLWLLFLVFLALFVTGVADAAGPSIGSLGIHRGQDVYDDGTVGYHEMLDINVSDPDGVGDIASVSITDTEGGLHVIGPGGADDAEWMEETAWGVYVHWWDGGDGGTAAPPPPGVYSVTVTDLAGNSESLTADPVGPVPEISVEGLDPTPNYAVVLETVPSFSWTSIPGAEHEVRVHHVPDWGLLWQASTGAGSSVAYNFDGTSLQPELTPGDTYGWLVVAWWPDSAIQTDPRVYVQVAPHSFGRFIVYSPEPVIQDVQLDRGHDSLAPDWTEYHQRVYLRAFDADGAGDIASITITDSAGVEHVKTPDCGCWWQDDDYTVGCEWSEWGLLAPPVPGSYAVTVADSGGLSDSLTTAAAPPVWEIHPELTSPAMDSVIYETVPTFAWTPGLPGAWTGMWVEEEGTGWIWGPDVNGQTSAVYNFDGSAPQPELLPNHTYLWTVNCWSPDDDRVSDSRVSIMTAQHIHGRFTVYGEWADTPPALDGKLTYENVLLTGWDMTSILEYGTDPHLRTWMGPEGASNPEWSPDGSKLLYSGPSWPSIWVDSQDGGPPVQVPGAVGFDATWAPDGERLVYELPSASTYDIWVSAVDGSYSYPLVESDETYDRYPTWSPDGLWIAYRKLPEPDPQGFGTHLVRYDGTEDHALIATGLAGVAYEGYEIGYMGDPAWSPDGTDLAVTFSALKPGGDPDNWDDYTEGIGRLSREGGLITPVFVSPPGYYCCAGAALPWWSPDGTKIGFNSGWHLPYDPEWADPTSAGLGKFEPGVELWMMNADGSGEPVRLTYNNSLDCRLSWWAPNTEPETPGDPATVTAGDTTVTFESVESGGTTTAITFDVPPGPDPGGFQFLGDFYEVTTNATLAPDSKITIQIHYDDADVPGGQEEWLSLMHWEGDRWVDVTVRPIDTVNNIITGECTSLSAFGIAFGPQFVGLLSPINNDGSSIFKLNRTVPVKFQLKNADGSFMTDALAKLYVAKVTDQVVGSYEEPMSTSAADSGNTFRYDAEADQYIFNLGTKGLSTGTWVLQVTVNGMVAKEVWISLR